MLRWLPCWALLLTVGVLPAHAQRDPIIVDGVVPPVVFAALLPDTLAHRLPDRRRQSVYADGYGKELLVYATTSHQWNHPEGKGPSSSVVVRTYAGLPVELRQRLEKALVEGKQQRTNYRGYEAYVLPKSRTGQAQVLVFVTSRRTVSANAGTLDAAWRLVGQVDFEQVRQAAEVPVLVDPETRKAFLSPEAHQAHLAETTPFAVRVVRPGLLMTFLPKTFAAYRYKLHERHVVLEELPEYPPLPVSIVEASYYSDEYPTIDVEVMDWFIGSDTLRERMGEEAAAWEGAIEMIRGYQTFIKPDSTRWLVRVRPFRVVAVESKEGGAIAIRPLLDAIDLDGLRGVEPEEIMMDGFTGEARRGGVLFEQPDGQRAYRIVFPWRGSEAYESYPQATITFNIPNGWHYADGIAATDCWTEVVYLTPQPVDPCYYLKEMTEVSDAFILVTDLGPTSYFPDFWRRLLEEEGYAALQSQLLPWYTWEVLAPPRETVIGGYPAGDRGLCYNGPRRCRRSSAGCPQHLDSGPR